MKIVLVLLALSVSVTFGQTGVPEVKKVTITAETTDITDVKLSPTGFASGGLMTYRTTLATVNRLVVRLYGSGKLGDTASCDNGYSFTYIGDYSNPVFGPSVTMNVQYFGAGNPTELRFSDTIITARLIQASQYKISRNMVFANRLSFCDTPAKLQPVGIDLTLDGFKGMSGFESSNGFMLLIAVYDNSGQNIKMYVILSDNFVPYSTPVLSTTTITNSFGDLISFGIVTSGSDYIATHAFANQYTDTILTGRRSLIEIYKFDTAATTFEQKYQIETTVDQTSLPFTFAFYGSADAEKIRISRTAGSFSEIFKIDSTGNPELEMFGTDAGVSCKFVSFIDQNRFICIDSTSNLYIHKKRIDEWVIKPFNTIDAGSAPFTSVSASREINYFVAADSPRVVRQYTGNL